MEILPEFHGVPEAVEYADVMLVDATTAPQPDRHLETAKALRVFADRVALRRTLEPTFLEQLDRIVNKVPIALRFNAGETQRSLSLPKAAQLLRVEFGPDVFIDDGAAPEQDYNADLLVGILALSVYARDPNYHLRRCIVDGQWFEPAARSSGSKFCRPQCRNRFHYRRSKNHTFACAVCNAKLPIEQFSGIAAYERDAHPAAIDDPDVLCTACAHLTFPFAADYIGPRQTESGSA